MGWYVIKTHGTEFQSGLPDLFCTHSRYGMRWIEIKNPKAYRFTPAQMDVFPKMSANGAKIHVLTSDDDADINNALFGPENWFMFLIK